MINILIDYHTTLPFLSLGFPDHSVFVVPSWNLVRSWNAITADSAVFALLHIAHHNKAPVVYEPIAPVV